MYFRLKNTANTRYHAWVREYVVVGVMGEYPVAQESWQRERNGFLLIYRTKEEAEAAATSANKRSLAAWQDFVNA